MQPIGSSDPRAGAASPSTSTSGRAFWATVIGMAVMVLIFVFAVIQAANEQSVLGWILAAIAFGWLALAVYALFLVRGTLRFGKSAVRKLQSDLAEAQLKAPSAGTSAAPRQDEMRDQKLAHSFQIVLVQNKVLKEELAKGEKADPEVVDRAIDTINFTAKNGMGMVRSDQTVDGTVVD
ncbi:hypothetical protein [Kocuria massiliensis]|uniref:hypothetical protein n=1 Tax=Kocuria massiliensis TaxID=1926282 RepID=UPI0022B97551|nr:hypothetical protein [Kocuria massiliensis]